MVDDPAREDDSTSDEPMPEPSQSSKKSDLVGIVILAVLAIGLWVGGTFLAHWLFETSWLVSALLAPAAIAVLVIILVLFK